MARIFLAACLGLAILTASACGDDATSTTPSATTPERSTEFFTGTLSAGQLQFYSFATVAGGSTDVTLLSVRQNNTPASSLTTVLGLGLGTPQGTGCALSSALTSAPSLVAQLRASTGVSTYCVAVADIGNLQAPVDFAIRIVHP